MRPIAALLPSLCLLGPEAISQWSVPVPVSNVNSASAEFDPSPTFDGLTLYFSSAQTGNYEIFRAVRPVPFGAYAAPIQIMELAASGTDAGPWPRIDDLEIFFYSNRPGGFGGGLDLWKADRASTSVQWNPPVAIAELNTAATDAAPSLTADGLRMYFNSTRPGGAGTFDLWTASRPNWTSPFGTATAITELNTPGMEIDPHISLDGLTIFFTSDRAGGVGTADTWMATRLDLASPFGTPINLTALNSTFQDYAVGAGLYHDEIFFTSNRPGGPGSYDLHSARFTGLIGSGIASAGSQRTLRFSDPASSGLVYLAAASRGRSPGIPIDSRVLPLNFDLLLQLTLGGLPPIMTGYVGLLDRDGIATGTISFAGFPQFRGLRFFNAFVVIDLSAPSGIKTISNAEEMVVQ